MEERSFKESLFVSYCGKGLRKRDIECGIKIESAIWSIIWSKLSVGGMMKSRRLFGDKERTYAHKIMKRQKRRVQSRTHEFYALIKRAKHSRTRSSSYYCGYMHIIRNKVQPY